MTNEQFLQQFGHFIDAPNGIQKLREMVLQLGLQGKLVPHNDDEAPVSDLFERVKVKQEQLLEKGLVKKEKSLPAISNEEIKHLPKGWRTARLAEITGFTIGRTPPTKESRYWDDSGIPWVAISDLIDKGHVSATTKHVTEEAQAKIFKQPPLRAGTILVSFKLTIGKISILDIDAYHNEAIASLIPYADEMQRFLFIFLPQLMQGGDTKNAIKGKTLNSTSLKRLVVPVPPLPEQHRIVAKVDELMALCDQLEAERNAREANHQRLIRAVHHPLTATGSDSAHNGIDSLPAWHRIRDNFADLYTTLESVQALRQTILQLAVQGRLVEQDPHEQPVAELLKEIDEEKTRLVLGGCLNKSSLGFSKVDGNFTFTVPHGWEVVRFGDVVSMRLGKMLDKGKNKGELKPYLRNTNVQWQRFDLSDVKEMRFEVSELDEYEVVPGDLLICEGGEPGRCAIWNGKVEHIYFQKALHRVRPFGGILSKYLLLRILSDTWSGFLSAFYTGATIKHLTGKALASYYFALPPLAEQHRIVAKVDQLMTLCDQLEANIRNKNDIATRYAEAVVNRIAAA